MPARSGEQLPDVGKSQGFVVNSYVFAFKSPGVELVGTHEMNPALWMTCTNFIQVFPAESVGQVIIKKDNVWLDRLQQCEPVTKGKCSEYGIF